MPLQNDFFKPEEIDQQIEALSSTSLQINHLQVHDRQHMRLIQHLRRFYRTNKEEDAHTLDAAWERIIHERVHAKLPINTQEKMHEMRSITENNGISTKRKTLVWRKIGILAAVLLIVALVGSMVVMFNQARQSSRLGGSEKVEGPQKAQKPVQDVQLNLYVTDFTSIYKIDSKTGKKDWTFNPNHRNTQRPLVMDGMVYFSSGDAYDTTYVYALNASNGVLSWKLKYSSVDAVANGIAYVAMGNADNVHIDLAAIDAKTGKLLWHYNPGLQSDVATVSNGVVYGAGSVDMNSTGALYALDAVKGTVLWNIQVPDQGFNLPQIVDNTVYATSTRDNKNVVPPVRSGYAYAFDAKTGKRLWQTAKIDAYVVPTKPVISHDVMYVMTNNVENNTSTLYALRTSDGGMVWNKFIDGEVDTAPIVINGSVYTGVTSTSHGTYVLALKVVDGSVRWSHPMTTSPQTMGDVFLVVGPSVLYASTVDTVFALNISNGAQLQVYQVIKSSPMFFNFALRVTLAP